MFITKKKYQEDLIQARTDGYADKVKNIKAQVTQSYSEGYKTGYNTGMGMQKDIETRLITRLLAELNAEKEAAFARQRQTITPSSFIRGLQKAYDIIATAAAEFKKLEDSANECKIVIETADKKD